MSTLLSRRSTNAFAIGLFAILPAACVAPGGYGYGYGGEPAYGLGYYGAPYVANYGGWRPGYQVAPYYGGGHPAPFVRGGPPQRGGYRPASAARPMPSIPMAARGGGHGGGAPRGGGGGHGGGEGHR